jgi:hypothetical protein
LPVESVRDLLGEGEWIEGLEENAGETKTCEPALVNALHFGGEQKDGNVGDPGILLHVAEGGGTVDAGHHDVHEDGVGLFGGGDLHAIGSRACGKDLPASGGFEGESGYLANVVFVVDDENASHERI